MRRASVFFLCRVVPWKASWPFACMQPFFKEANLLSMCTCQQEDVVILFLFCQTSPWWHCCDTYIGLLEFIHTRQVVVSVRIVMCVLSGVLRMCVIPRKKPSGLYLRKAVYKKSKI